MKKILALLLAITPVAFAAPPDYAMQWPVQATGNAGAYAITLTPDVYRTVQRPDLRDLDVLDATGRAVPAEVVAPSAASSTQRIALPWFAMPSPEGATTARWRVIADLDADGRLRALRSGDAGTATPTRATTLLLDAGALRETVPGGGLVALELDWTPGTPFDRAYRVEGSDDFDVWQSLGRGRLVDVQQDGRRLRLDRIALGAVPVPRYLRLVSEDGDAPLPPVTQARVQVARAIGAAPQWLTLAPRGAGRTFEFDLPGRYPVRWVDLDVGGNDVREWRLQSRDGDGEWTDRIVGWAVYRVDTRRSPAQVFDRPIRDRHWRLVAATAGAPPRLRLGYRPEQLRFVAAGTAPYLVVAGSAAAQRAAPPVGIALDGDVAPTDARLGPPATRAGATALAVPRDWKTWGLWAVLALGVAVVAAFALRVLREPPPRVD